MEAYADEPLVPNRGEERAAVQALSFMTSEKVRVVVGDDHPLFRDGVVRALTSSGSIEVVAEADDGVAALEADQGAFAAGGAAGLPHAGHGRRRRSRPRCNATELPTRVLLVSAHDESAIVYRALQEGAAGFLPKESTRSELVNAVLSCAKGPRHHRARPRRRLGRRDPPPQRTRRAGAESPRA